MIWLAGGVTRILPVSLPRNTASPTTTAATTTNVAAAEVDDPVVALRPSEAGAHRVEHRVGIFRAGSSVSKRRRSSLSSGSNSKSSVIPAPAIRGVRHDPRASGTSPRPPTAASTSRSRAPRVARRRTVTPRCAVGGAARDRHGEVVVRWLGRRNVGRGLAREPRPHPSGTFFSTEVVAEPVERDVADPTRGRVVPRDAPPTRVGTGERVLHGVGCGLPVAARSRE